MFSIAKVDKKGSPKVNIRLTRGDTARFRVSLYSVVDEERTKIELHKGDYVKFTLRKEIDAPILLQKIFNGDNLIHIAPDDTSSMDFGKYVYDVEVTMSNGDVYTVIPPSVFDVEEEVGYDG